MHVRCLCLVVCIINTIISNLANGINITVDQEAESFSCERNETSITCKNLDLAINYAASLNQTAGSNNGSSVSILLPNGVHLVTTQTNFGDVSVNFVGVDSNVSVACEYYADNETSDSALIHTWYFNMSESVGIENIQFRDCGFPFRFFVVEQVAIRNCTFMNFSEAVLDIYNCRNVSLDRISLRNNSGNGRLFEPVRGNSGSVAIGYNMLPTEFTNPTLTLSNSDFIENRAMGFLTPERAVIGQVFQGRGGGMALYMNESYQDIRVEMTDCVFENNVANLFGGGLFMLTTSYKTVQHIVRIERSRFTGNMCSSGGAGMQLSFLSEGDTSRPHTVTLRDCTFDGNRGTSGGGVYIFSDGNGNKARLEGCNFTNNGGLGTQNDLGAAVALSYLVRFVQRVTSTRQEIVNCSFMRNSSPNGVLSVGYMPVRFSGRNSFTHNRGASLRIVGQTVDFEGEVEFTNNSVKGEGALYLRSFGQIRIHKGTHFVFDGNIGKLGSSIVVDSLASLVSFDDLLFNPRCFILYENRTATPQEWENVSVSFRRNEAVVSSAVYLLQRGDVCSWFKQTPPFFNNSFLPDWSLWSYEDNRNYGYSDSLNQVHSFGTIAQQFSLQGSNNENELSAWPGKRFSATLVGLDDFNSRTSVSARLMFQPNQLSTQNISAESVRFKPQIIILVDDMENNGLLPSSFPFSYGVRSPDLVNIQPTDVELGQVVAEEAFNPHPIVSGNFSLFPLPCLGGYKLTLSPNTDTMVCTCVTKSEEVVFCEEDQDTIVLKYGTWASYNPTHPSQLNLYFHQCPAGYCSCTFNSTLVQGSVDKMCIYQYQNSNPDDQCVCGREGILCGSCKDAGVSVLLNSCVTCSDGLLTLIPLLVMIIVIVFITIILVDKPFPEWTVPFLFYIQNAPYATQYFPETFEFAGKYLHYLSSASSFYFVYDFCLSSHLSTAHSYLLRYIPALTALIVFFAMWLVRRKILKKKTLLNHGCWWCLLLIYSSVTHTSMSALHCTSVPSNDTVKSRWFLSGDMECFTGAHVPLALLAIVMLLAGVFFIVLVALLPSMRFSIFKNYKKPFTGSYKENMGYWSGIELARRFIFILALVPFPRNTVYAILLLVVSTSLYAYNLPYKSKIANILEIVVQLNFLALLLLDITPIIRDELFVFGGDTNNSGCNIFSRVSYIVMLLAPVYYVPVVLLLVVASAYLILFINSYRKKCEREKETVKTESGYGEMVKAANFTSQSFEIEYSQAVIPFSDS